MPDINVRYADLQDELGWWDPDSKTIWLANGQTRAERRCTLAHELEHISRGDENVTAVSSVLATRQEIAASMRAARRLIPIEDLIGVLLWSKNEQELAEELNVDEDTMRIRLLTLTPAEHALIDERLCEAERETA